MRAIILLVMVAVSCAGCPATLTPEAMKTLVPGPLHRSTTDVLIGVFGATEISVMKPIHITDEGFAQALATSIEQSALFRKVLRDTPGTYQLQATFVRLDEDIFGIDMTASMTVNYVLARTAPKGAVWEQSVTTSHTVGMNESVIQITRLQLATEGAVRKNIEQAIIAISKLTLE